MDLPLRVDKFVSDATGMSRESSRKAVLEGRVSIAGQVFTGDDLVYPEDEVCLDGQPILRRRPTGVVMWHKPVGVVCSVRDPDGAEDLSGWLSSLPEGYAPVGRLDKDTSGLLLATDDGELAHMLLHPRHHLEKEYLLEIVGEVEMSDSRIAALRSVVLDDGEAKALSVSVVSTGAVSVLSLVIDEGRNRIVRRMARAVGCELLGLRRVRMGPVTIGDLGLRESRFLERFEYDTLWDAVGGRVGWVRGHCDALRKMAVRLRHMGRRDAKLEAWLETFAEG